MGWTTTNKPYKMKIIDFIEQELFSNIEDKKKYEIIDRASSKKAVFFAVKNKQTGKVSAEIILVNFKPKGGFYNISYKEMSENCGPYYPCMKKSLLKKLTETDSEYAKEWRKKSYDEIEKKSKLKAKINDIVKVQGTYRLPNGKKTKFLQVIDLRRNKAIAVEEINKDEYKQISDIYTFVGFNRKIKEIKNVKKII
jgi:LAS superfamily LD-carboxypeptidase LdcB